MQLLFETGAQIFRDGAIVVTGVVTSQGIQGRLHGCERGQTVHRAVGSVERDVVIDERPGLLLLIAAGRSLLGADRAQQRVDHRHGVIDVGTRQAVGSA